MSRGTVSLIGWLGLIFGMPIWTLGTSLFVLLPLTGAHAGGRGGRLNKGKGARLGVGAPLLS